MKEVVVFENGAGRRRLRRLNYPDGLNSNRFLKQKKKLLDNYY